MDSRIRTLFVSESRKRIAEGEASLASSGPTSGRVQALFRSFHTLKGMSAQMGIGPMTLLAHTLEEVCDAVSRGGVADSEELQALLAEGIEALTRQVRSVDEGQDPTPAAELEDRIRRHLRSASSTGFRLLDVPEELAPGPEPPTADPTIAAVAEILAACTRMRELAGHNRLLRPEVVRVERATRALYGRLAEARQVTFGTIVPALRRQLRGVCAEAEKDAALDVLGEDLRIDPDILGTLQGALSHLLSNAVVHGIEGPQARRAAGKPRTGRVEIIVQRQGDRLVVSLSDDGRGFDLPALQAKAQDPTNQNPVALALREGVSTAGQVGAHAGRGVGLGTAWRLVESVAGTMEAETVRGAGSRFRLNVPALALPEELTLVEAGGHLLALPAQQITANGYDAAAPALLGLEVGGPVALTLRGEGRFRVDRVVGTIPALVTPPPFPLNRLPRVSGTTVAPDGRILFVVRPAGPEAR